MIGLKKNITILSLILLWISCGSERNIELQNNPPSSNLKLKSSFRKLEVLSKEKDNIAVGFLDKLGIKYTVYKIEHPSQEIDGSPRSKEKLKEMLYFTSWEIILDPITREQFYNLKEKFLSNIELSTFDPTKKYNISNFLPKPWKDLMGGSFELGKRPDQNNQGRFIWDETNCFSTAIASLNFLFTKNKKFPKFASGYKFFLNLITKITKTRKTLTSKTIKPPEANTYNLGLLKLHGYDYITKHGYIFLDDTWVFERVGNDSALPYRLAPRKAVYACYNFYHEKLRGFYSEEIIEIDLNKAEEITTSIYDLVVGNFSQKTFEAFEFSSDIYE